MHAGLEAKEESYIPDPAILYLLLGLLSFKFLSYPPRACWGGSWVVHARSGSVGKIFSRFAPAGVGAKRKSYLPDPELLSLLSGLLSFGFSWEGAITSCPGNP